MWKAHVEYISAVLRVFPQGCSYGDPYEFACTLRWVDNRTVEMVGVDKSPTVSMYRPIFDILCEQGVEKLIFWRKGRLKEFDLLKYANKRDNLCLEEKTPLQELE